MKDKKGLSPITVFFWIIVFVMLWALFLGSWLTTSGESAVNNNNLTGVEAFVFMNLNLLVFVVLIIFILAYLYLGGGGG